MLHLQLPLQVFAQCLAGFIGEFADRPAFAIPAAILNSRGRALLPDVLGTDGLNFSGCFGGGLRNIGQIFHLEHDVFFEGVLNLRIQIQNWQL